MPNKDFRVVDTVGPSKDGTHIVFGTNKAEDRLWLVHVDQRNKAKIVHVFDTALNLLHTDTPPEQVIRDAGGE